MPSHILYIDPISAPCRAVHLHLALLAGNRAASVLDVEVRPLSLFKGEHKSDEFLVLNPRHTVPTLVTPFGVLLESRAIMMYFAELLALSDPSAQTYYPRRLFDRACVHQLLDWDQGTFYKAVGAAVYPSFTGGEATHEQLEAVVDVLGHLDTHVLADRDFVTGAAPTIADVSIAMGVTMLELPDISPDDCPNVDAWMGRLRAAPGWAEVNQPYDAFVAQRRVPSVPAPGSSAEAADESDPGEASQEARDVSEESLEAAGPPQRQSKRKRAPDTLAR